LESQRQEIIDELKDKTEEKDIAVNEALNTIENAFQEKACTGFARP